MANNFTFKTDFEMYGSLAQVSTQMGIPIDAPRLQGLHQLEYMTHAHHDIQHIEHIQKT